MFQPSKPHGNTQTDHAMHWLVKRTAFYRVYVCVPNTDTDVVTGLPKQSHPCPSRTHLLLLQALEYITYLDIWNIWI